MTRDQDRDGIPDAFAEVNRIAANADKQAAIIDMVSRLPHSPQTRALQRGRSPAHAVGPDARRAGSGQNPGPPERLVRSDDDRSQLYQAWIAKWSWLAVWTISNPAVAQVALSSNLTIYAGSWNASDLSLLDGQVILVK